jgi:hypothetical protein
MVICPVNENVFFLQRIIVEKRMISSRIDG